MQRALRDFEQLHGRLRGEPTSFLTRTDGAAGVEFAIIAPLMILLMMGVFDLGQGLSKYRHAFQAAASLARTAAHISIANVASGETDSPELTSNQSEVLTNGIVRLMGAADAAQLSASARRVVKSATGGVDTVWSWSSDGAGAEGVGNEVAALIKPGESLMVVDVSFKHDYLFAMIGISQTFTARYSANVPSY